MFFGKPLSKPLQYIFIIACVVALTYPLFNIFFIFPSFKGVLIKDSEDIAQIIAHHFSRDNVSFNNLSLTPGFASEAEQLKEEFNLEKLRVFSETGIIVYSSDKGEIGMINQDAYFRDIVSKGSTFSQLVKKGKSQDPARLAISPPSGRPARFCYSWTPTSWRPTCL